MRELNEDSTQDGVCSYCEQQYNHLEGRQKLRSKKCGHALRETCVMLIYEVRPRACFEPGCEIELREEDFEKMWDANAVPLLVSLCRTSLRESAKVSVKTTETQEKAPDEKNATANKSTATIVEVKIRIER